MQPEQPPGIDFSEIKLEWVVHKSGLLERNCQLELRKSIRDVLKMEEKGNAYVSGTSYRQLLLNALEKAEEKLPQREGSERIELDHFKEVLKDSIMPMGLPMDRTILKQLEWHPLVQFPHQKYYFIYKAWLIVSSCEKNRKLYKETITAFIGEKIEDRLERLRPKLRDAFSKIYHFENEHLDKYEENWLGVLDFAKNIITHCDSIELKKIKDKRKQLDREMSKKFQGKGLKFSKDAIDKSIAETAKEPKAGLVRQNEAERGIAISFPELALHIFNFCLIHNIEIRKEMFKDEDLADRKKSANWGVRDMDTGTTWAQMVKKTMQGQQGTAVGTKPVSSDQGTANTAAFEVPANSVEATCQSQPVSSVLDSEEATSKLQTKMEELHLPQCPQHKLVILPNHIHVPESVGNKLSFGSFGDTFGITNSYVRVPESEKSSTPRSETSQVIEEALEEQSASNRNALTSVPETSAPTTTSTLEASDTNQEVEGYSVYVRNFPWSVTADQLEVEFKKFGPIKEGGIQVRNNKQQGYSFGFVEFQSRSSMNSAIQASPIDIGGRQAVIEIKRAPSRIGSSGSGRFASAREGLQNDSFRGHGNSNDGRSLGRNEYVSRDGFYGRDRGPAVLGGDGYGRADGYQQQGRGASYQQQGRGGGYQQGRGAGYEQGRGGGHQQQGRGTGYQQMREVGYQEKKRWPSK